MCRTDQQRKGKMKNNGKCPVCGESVRETAERYPQADIYHMSCLMKKFEAVREQKPKGQQDENEKTRL